MRANEGYVVIEKKASISNNNKRSELALMEYKTRHDCLGKVIPLELYKKLKFDHTVTATSLKSQNGTLFSHVWKWCRLAVDPL